jgi:hypothetical protein
MTLFEMFAVSAWGMAQKSTPENWLTTWVQVSNWFYGAAIVSDPEVSEAALCLSLVALERSQP